MKNKSFYDLTQEEISKYQTEFNKTPYGRIQMKNRAASLIIFIIIFIAVFIFEDLFAENAPIITFFEYIGSFSLLYFIANCIFNNINLKNYIAAKYNIKYK